jgi:hypothetical protein
MALTVILMVGFAISGAKLVGYTGIREFLGPMYDYSMPILVCAFILKNVLGGMSASGAFEIVDAASGKVLFSKLRSGKMPESLSQVMQIVDKEYPLVKGDSAGK